MTIFEIYQHLKEPNTASMLVRLTLAAFCGGLIGIGRVKKRRPAGFRTHTLVCLGAALTMVISTHIKVCMRLAVIPLYKLRIEN